MKTALMFLFANLAAVAAAVAQCPITNQFVSINGLLCIRSQFVETHALTKSQLDCSLLCHRRQQCQAFSIADGPCQLFVFDKCSKQVRDCNCTRRSQVFVRQQPGLPPGALCPVGFADDLCGTKYKLYSGISDWDTASARIGAEPGLVIMADVMDSAEMTQIKSLFTKYNWQNFVMLGGHLLGNVAGLNNWFWVSCNISISTNLWGSSEPNGGIGEPVAATANPASYQGIADTPTPWNWYSGALAECVSPFD